MLIINNRHYFHNLLQMLHILFKVKNPVWKAILAGLTASILHLMYMLYTHHDKTETWVIPQGRNITGKIVVSLLIVFVLAICSNAFYTTVISKVNNNVHARLHMQDLLIP
jgi:ABC-type transporter Mla maintaining outer membrane lipid asymmetry permease subunit MlaE